MLNLLSL